MNITINGKTYELPEAATLDDALHAAKMKTQGIATALNNRVVVAAMGSKTVLNDGDKIVVITAFYGG